MDADASHRTGINTGVAEDALIFIKDDMTIPGQRLSRTRFNAWMVFAGDTNMDAADIRPVILDMNPCLLDTLQARFMGRGTGQHAQSAIGAATLLDFEHRRLSSSEYY